MKNDLKLPLTESFCNYVVLAIRELFKHGIMKTKIIQSLRGNKREAREVVYLPFALEQQFLLFTT